MRHVVGIYCEFRENEVRFDEHAWDAEPAIVLDYFLLGFPEDLNQLRGNLVNFRASMFRVARYAERPDDFPEEDPAIYFYGPPQLGATSRVC